jgi:hypothetical protein
MLTEPDRRPPAAATDTADRRPTVAPEVIDERLKRLPRDAERRPALPPEIEALFGPPPLILGEDGEAYDNLLLAVADAVKPKDVIEGLYVKDIADLTWQGQRLKRLQAQLLTQEIQIRLHDDLALAFRAMGKSVEDSRRLAAEAATAFITNDQKVITRTRKALPEPIDLERVAAKALTSNLDVYVTLDRRITTAAAGRLAVEREIERRRQALARRWRLEHAVAAPRASAGAGSAGR